MSGCQSSSYRGCSLCGLLRLHAVIHTLVLPNCVTIRGVGKLGDEPCLVTQLFQKHLNSKTDRITNRFIKGVDLGTDIDTEVNDAPREGKEESFMVQNVKTMKKATGISRSRTFLCHVTPAAGSGRRSEAAASPPDRFWVRPLPLSTPAIS